MAEYLIHLRIRHFSPKMLQTTLGALVTFFRLLPQARQPSLWQDVTRQTPATDSTAKLPPVQLVQATPV